MQNFHEKRTLPRLLCDESFSPVTLRFGSQCIIVNGINFNYLGLGLFGPDRLPAEQHCQLDFSYCNAESIALFSALPAIVVFSSHTEVGCQIGIHFDEQKISPEDTRQLRQLHQLLEARQAESRYNFD